MPTELPTITDSMKARAEIEIAAREVHRLHPNIPQDGLSFALAEEGRADA